MNPLLSPKDLAAILGIAEQTIYNRLSGGGDLPPYLKLGRLLRFRQEDVELWLVNKLSPDAVQHAPLSVIAEPIPRRRGRPSLARLSRRRNATVSVN